MSPLRVVLLVVVLLTLVDVATPPVIEDHREVGFCSADCPAQLPGHGTGITVAPSPSSAAHTTAADVVLARDADVDLGAVAASDAPRAPPSA
jgi:hypothetical protein